MKAIIQDIVLADSDNTIKFDGYCYFPQVDVKMSLLVESNHGSECPYKGIANYFHFSRGKLELKMSLGHILHVKMA